MSDDSEEDSWERILHGALDEGGADVLGERLLDMLVWGAAREMELPHVLVCTDYATGAVTLSGPYPNGLAALCAAEADHVTERRQDADSSMVFSVMSLISPGVSESAD